MKPEEVLGMLQDAGFVLDEEKAIPYGRQFAFRNGSKVTVYDKGTITPQGKHVDEVKAILGMSAPGAAASGHHPRTQLGSERKYSSFTVMTATRGLSWRQC